jgi:tetratricopeptide (TPR) repeat protein
VPVSGVAARAESVLAIAESDPRRAARLAADAHRELAGSGDRAALARLEYAWGLATRADRDVATSVGHLRAALGHARAAGETVLTGHVLNALGGALAQAGRFRAALAVLDQVPPGLDDVLLAKVLGQRAYLLLLQGRLAPALQGFDQALVLFRSAGDLTGEALSLSNRAVVLSRRGEHDLAVTDLRLADRLFGQLGDERGRVETWAVLGWALARRGDLPEALHLFNLVDEHFHGTGEVDPLILLDRCEVLVGARLFAEALAAAQGAERALAASRAYRLLAESRLRVAEVALLVADVGTARAATGRALRSFARQGRPELAALARLSALRVAVASGRGTARLLEGAPGLARELEMAGWRVAGLDVRLIAARAALDRGRVELARDLLAETAGAHSGGPVELRSRLWHARALLRWLAGDRRGAEAALRAGFAMLGRHQASLGGSELRALAGGHGTALTALGVAVAIAGQDPLKVLAWSERGRATALQHRPGRESGAQAGRESAELLERLRRANEQVDEALAGGRDAGPARAAQAQLEAELRRRSWAARPRGPAHEDGGSGQPAVPPVGRLRALLGERVLVELLVHREDLYAVLVPGHRTGLGRPALHRLGPMAEVQAELDAIRFALRRLVRRHGSARSVEAAGQALRTAAGRLDALVLRPLAGLPDGVGLVLVPTGVLHAVPWSVLPTCAGRPVTVSPSASLWVRGEAGTGRPVARGTVLVSGPGLPGAADEVRRLHRADPVARVLDGGDATVGKVLAAVDGARTAHIAAHGRFRADHPHLSSLVLDGGTMTVYDLESLAEPPEVLVLSACEVGLAAVHPGDELQGVVGAVLSLGTRAVVASVVPVPDVAAVPLMLALHRELRSGRSPATALARAAADPEVDPADGAAAAFVCFGSG